MTAQAEYAMTPGAAEIVERYWPGTQKPGHSAAAKAAFQRKMNEMQVDLLRLHLPNMGIEARFRAARTLDDLSGRLAA